MWAVRLVAAAVVLVVVAVTLVLVRGRDGYVVEPDAAGSGAPAAAAAGEATRVLADLEQALRAHDARAAAALAPAGDQEAADRLAAVARNVAALDLRQVSLRYVDQDGPVDAQGRWTAVVQATWQIPGFDRRAADTEVDVALTQTDGRVAVRSFGGGGRRSPLWLQGPVTVDRQGRVLIIAARASDARRLEGLARTAVAQVGRRLDLPDTSLVLEIPASGEGLDAALGAEPGTYRQIAAVTAPVDGSDPATAPIHVFVNPAVMDELDRDGAQVVLTHETTHAATRAPASKAPTWLIEGFADWVALQEVRLPLSVTTARLATRIEKDGVPDALPTADDFGVDRTDLEATYESAWQLCVTIAEESGAAALRRLYDRASGGAPIASTLKATTGLDVDSLTRLWQQRLRALPEPSGESGREAPDVPVG